MILEFFFLSSNKKMLHTKKPEPTRWQRLTQTVRWFYYGKFIPFYETTSNLYKIAVIESLRKE